MFIATLFMIAKIGKQPKCPLTDDVIFYLSIYLSNLSMYTVEYCLAIKNEILPFASTWMDLEGIIISEISQRKTNITQKETDSQI